MVDRFVGVGVDFGDDDDFGVVVDVGAAPASGLDAAGVARYTVSILISESESSPGPASGGGGGGSTSSSSSTGMPPTALR